MCHRRVTNRRDVAIGEHEAVAVSPARVFAPMIQDMEIESGKNVRHTERPGRVAASGRNKHANYGFPNIAGFFLKKRYFFFTERCAHDLE
jgi:hypothetical protein